MSSIFERLNVEDVRDDVFADLPCPHVIRDMICDRNREIVLLRQLLKVSEQRERFKKPDGRRVKQ